MVSEPWIYFILSFIVFHFTLVASIVATQHSPKLYFIFLAFNLIPLATRIPTWPHMNAPKTNSLGPRVAHQVITHSGTHIPFYHHFLALPRADYVHASRGHLVLNPSVASSGSTVSKCHHSAQSQPFTVFHLASLHMTLSAICMPYWHLNSPLAFTFFFPFNLCPACYSSAHMNNPTSSHNGRGWDMWQPASDQSQTIRVLYVLDENA